MTELRTNQHNDFMVYPTNHLVGLLDDEAALNATVDAVGQLPDAPDIIKALHGQVGATLLDAGGDDHGFYGLIARAVQAYSIERSNLEMFESALRDGKYVVLIPVSDEQRDAVATALAENGGHAIYHYGELVVTEMKR